MSQLLTGTATYGLPYCTAQVSSAEIIHYKHSAFGVPTVGTRIARTLGSILAHCIEGHVIVGHAEQHLLLSRDDLSFPVLPVQELESAISTCPKP